MIFLNLFSRNIDLLSSLNGSYLLFSKLITIFTRLFDLLRGLWAALLISLFVEMLLKLPALVNALLEILLNLFDLKSNRTQIWLLL